MNRPPLDPARGAEAARKLKSLGVKGTLIKAAELGYITEVTCGMPRCFCPEELGGAGYFAPRTRQWNDWEATFEHYPIPKVEGGRKTVDNAVLAHRLHRADADAQRRRVGSAPALPHRATEG